MLLHYLKVAVRQLLKYRTQNLISIIGLGVCLLCFSVCLYVGRFILSTDSCFEHRDRIASIELLDETGTPFGNACIPLAHRLAAQLPAGVEAVTYINMSNKRDYTLTMPGGEELPYQGLSVLEVDTAFRQVFGTEVIAGSWEAAVRTQNAIVLTERTARRLFAQPAEAIGRPMLLTSARMMSTARQAGVTSDVAYTVQAVIRDLPANNSLTEMRSVDLLTVNDVMSYHSAYREADYILSGHLFALMRPGMTTDRLSDTFRQQDLKMTFGPNECPVAARPFGENFLSETGYLVFAIIFTALGTLILLVGLLNYFNFTCGAYLTRLREYALRRVSGSRPWQLLGLLFTQAVLTVALAFLVTGCLIEAWVPRLTFPMGDFNLEVDGGVLLSQCTQYLAGLLVLTLVVCAGTVVYAVRIPIQTGIRGTGRVRRGSRHIARNALLAVQFFTCWLFVALSVALYLQTDTVTKAAFNTLTEQQKKDILSIPLHYSILTEEDKRVLVDRLKQYAGVEDCLLAEEAYTGGMTRTGLFLDEGKSQDKGVDIFYHGIAPNFFRFMNIPIVQGENLRDSTGIVLSGKMAERLTRLTGREALGTVLYPWFGPAMTVCGLTGEMNTYLYAPPQDWDPRTEGVCYQYSDFSQYLGHCYLKCHPGQTDAVRRHVTDILKETFPPTIVPKVGTLQQDLEEECNVEANLRSLILFFALVCIAVTLLGVYAAITLDTERRRKEVAIRKVNGAGRRQIFRLFARLYAWLLVGTAVVAFPVIYLIFQQWQTLYVAFFNYGPLFWIGLFLGVTAVTALTVVFRINRIARVNPAEAVKTE